MKKKIFISLLALLAISLVGYSDIPPKPNPPRLVNDFVGVLTPDVLENLEQQLVQYDDSTSIQIAVVIVNNAIANGSDEAREIGIKWGVGQKGLNNGIVFFIAIESRKMFIATGYGIESDLTDATCYHICSEIVKPYFKSGDYAQGIMAGVDEIKKTLTTISWDERRRFKEEQIRQKKLERDELINTLVWNISGIFILGLLGWIMYSVMRKSKRVAEKVKQFRTYFANILSDEVTNDSSWPNWAKKDSVELFAQYVAYKAECVKLLATLPNFVLSRLFTDEKKFELIQKKLEAYDGVDRLLTKIRDDVKLYDTRALQAIVDAQKLAETVSSLITLGAKKFNFTREQGMLEDIQNEIAEKLVITDSDSKRTCFRLAYTLAEKLIHLEKNITAEMDAEKKVVASIDLFLEKQKLFSKMSTDYHLFLTKLSAYPSTVMNDIDTLPVLKGRMDNVSDLIANLQKKIAGSTPGVYVDAMLRMLVIEESISSIETIYNTASMRVEELIEKKDSYPNKLTEVETIVAKAEKEVKDSDVGKKARESARDARSQLTTAIRLGEAAKVDWILVHNTLVDAESKAKEAIEKTESDKSEAGEARSSNSKSTSNNSRPYIGSIGGGSGGGFGGFGGGSFGGGGGGSGW